MESKQTTDAATSPIRFDEMEEEVPWELKSKSEKETQTENVTRKIRKRSFDVEFKLEVLDYIENNSIEEAAKHFKVKRQIIRTWVEKRSELEKISYRNQGDRKRLDSPREKEIYGNGMREFYLQLEIETELTEVLEEWLKGLGSRGVVVTRRMLEDRAKSLWEEFASDTLPMKPDWVQEFVEEQAFKFDSPNMLWAQSSLTNKRPHEENTSDEKSLKGGKGGKKKRKKAQTNIKPTEVKMLAPALATVVMKEGEEDEKKDKGETSSTSPLDLLIDVLSEPEKPKPAKTVMRQTKLTFAKQKQPEMKVDFKAKIQAQMKKLCG